jgi:hypothetical protein
MRRRGRGSEMVKVMERDVVKEFEEGMLRVKRRDTS